jgi:hypothetical protein
LTFAFGKGGQLTNLDTGSVLVDAPLDKPKDYVIEVYLHPRLEIAGNNRATLKWNGLPAFIQDSAHGVMVQKGLIAVAPEIYTFEDQLSREHYRIASEEERKHTPPSKITAILKARFPEMERQRAKCVQDYVDAKKPAFVYNPDYDLAAIPRLFMQSIEVEGPIVDWPPKGRTDLFFAGDDRLIDSSYIREIFSRFLPRAYRRAVEPKELETVYPSSSKPSRSTNFPAWTR